MLVSLAKSFTSYFIKKGDISADEQETYNYCFEIFLSTLLNTSFLVIVGLITNNFINTLLFMLGFIAFRSTSGGFHAGSHLSCFMTLVFVYSLMFVSMMFLKDGWLNLLSIIFTLIGMLVMFFFSPVEHPDNPLSGEQSAKLSDAAKWLSIAFAIIVIVMFAMGVKASAVFCLTYGLFSVAVSMMAVKLINSVKGLSRKSE